MSERSRLAGPRPARTPGERRALAVVFWLCAAAALAPLWSARHLPMVDLPQHAAQIAVAARYADPAGGFAGQFELRWFNPYALATALGAALHRVFELFVALKLLLSLYVLGMGLALYALIEEAGGDPWRAPLGFLLAYGFAFYWGFLPYLSALPLGLLQLALAYRCARRPGLGAGAALAAVSTLTLFAHVIVFCVCAAASALVLALERGSPLRARARAALPLAAPAALLVAWLGLRESGLGDEAPFIWTRPDLAARLAALPLNLLSAEPDAWAAAAAAAAAAATALGAGATPWRRLAPAGLALLLYFALPETFLSVTQTHQRLIVLAAAFSLAALGPAAASLPRAALHRGLVAGCVLVWMAALAARFRAFDRELRGLDEAIARIGPNRSVLSLSFLKGAGSAHPLSAQHLGAYYQALNGGKIGFSFAHIFHAVARYRPGAEPLGAAEAAALDWDPRLIDPAKARAFDYLLVRSRTDVSPLLARRRVPARLVLREGSWSVYALAGAERAR